MNSESNISSDHFSIAPNAGVWHAWISSFAQSLIIIRYFSKANVEVKVLMFRHDLTLYPTPKDSKNADLNIVRAHREYHIV